MSVAEPKRTQPRQKQKEPKSQAPAHGTERLKTVVRRLPPNLPEEIFWQSVQTWVTDESVTWKVYHAGKLRKRQNQENVPSRAYIAFKSEELLATFSREYDGHLFRDKAGNESQAIVEFAPFQKIPSEKKKPDARNATIDKDEDYISFLETLKNAGKSEHVPIETLVAASQPPAVPTTTPLLEALKAEKSAQKDKEAILRNHAHYKDSSIATVRKEETKKKAAAAAVASQKQAEAGPAPLSRKAKKAAAAQKAAPFVQATPVAKKVSAEGANLPPKPPPQAPPARTTPRSPRSARSQPKVAAASIPPPPKPAAQPAPSASGEPVPPAAPVSTRRGRPVVGLGRHFEAALNGAVGPGTGRKREKDGQPSVPGEAVQKDVPGRLRDVPSPSPGVPNILQRGEGHAPGSPMIMQRPQPARVPDGPAVVDAHPGRGGPPRRGRGRGRGAPRGG